MMMDLHKSFFVALTIALIATTQAQARGCGGGGFRSGGDFGGYRGGDFAGRPADDFGFRTDNGAHWGDPDPFDSSRGYDPEGSSRGVSDAAMENRAISADPDYANHAWNDTGIRQKELASDGFGNVMTSAPRNAMYDNHTIAMSRNDMWNNGNIVRNNYRNWNAFDRDWWGRHPYGWYNPWFNGGWCWGYCGWPALAGFWGVAATDAPIDYDYGNNITYQNNNVYYGTQPTASAEQYYDQADQLAQTAPPTPPPSSTTMQQKNWQSFGVFSLVQRGQSDSTMLMQLAVDKAGTIRGNYYNTLTDEVKPLSGAVDKKTMRAAWTVSGNKNVVYDTGVSNLLKAQSPILVHFSKNRTEQWTLVRLEKKQQSTT
jgi:hypothetical protein